MNSIAWNKIMCSLIGRIFRDKLKIFRQPDIFFQELLTRGSMYIGCLATQVSKQNLKVVRSGGQIIQGVQLVQGLLDHCSINLEPHAFSLCTAIAKCSSYCLHCDKTPKEEVCRFHFPQDMWAHQVSSKGRESHWGQRGLTWQAHWEFVESF